MEKLTLSTRFALQFFRLFTRLTSYSIEPIKSQSLKNLSSLIRRSSSCSSKRMLKLSNRRDSLSETSYSCQEDNWRTKSSDLPGNRTSLQKICSSWTKLTDISFQHSGSSRSRKPAWRRTRFLPHLLSASLTRPRKFWLTTVSRVRGNLWLSLTRPFLMRWETH